MAKFTTGEAIRYGWAKMLEHKQFLLTFSLLIGAIGFFSGIEVIARPVTIVIGQIITAVLGVYLTIAALRIVDGKHVGWDNAFTGLSFGMFMNYVLGAILLGLAAILGFILFIVPGIVISIGLSLFPYVIWDTKVGAVEALKRSWEITKGEKLHLFAAMLVIGLIIAVPLIVLAVLFGTSDEPSPLFSLLSSIVLVFALPFVSLAQLFIYRRLNPMGEAAVEQPAVLAAA